MKKSHPTKFIFVTGGVVSSLGKGVVAASLGALLETRGLKVVLTKADPYINVDPGTMNPTQHGEVFVTDDGAETDLDIGHYERFTTANLCRLNSFSAGQIYDGVLSRERKGEYQGGTVQVIPHITDAIKSHIFKASQGADISIVEIGGTVGDIEGLPFLESIRQIRYDLGDENVLFIHLTLVPYIKAARELKTKPTQHSVKELRQLGILPHVIICRSERKIPQLLREKIARTCDVGKDCVIECQDLDSIYKIPTYLNSQGLDQIVVDHLNIWTRSPKLNSWQKVVDAIDNPNQTIRVGIVGKYTDVIDSYKSIDEALTHAGIHHSVKVVVSYIEAEKLNEDNVSQILGAFDGIVIPGGFGNRGIEGKLAAIKYVRESNKAFLGICLGMQLAAIEFARNVLSLDGSHSTEFAPETPYPIIDLMENQKEVKQLGGSMRLGAYPCKIDKDSKAYLAYKDHQVSERHRHRYEFNPEFRKNFVEKGILFSGLSPDESLVEMIEIPSNNFYIACQFHPELKSSPMSPHPLFRYMIESILNSR